ncbi:MAG TPA: gamma-glutamylcyclotransferase family protein [Actinomycetota bacterium]|nr:gamma-glutamylcyclotransferase family protein [Actinomycetota bacterium]
MSRYFAYGANMDPRHMLERVPGASVIGPARLDGYRLEFNVYSSEWDGGAANLEPDPDGRVWGVLWELPDDQLSGLDAYEGHPVFFRREEVTVQGPVEPAIAWTFRVAHQDRSYVRPTDSYVQLLRSAVRVQGLPPDALDIIERSARPPRPTIST